MLHRIAFLCLCTVVCGQLIDVFSEGENDYNCFKIPALLATQNGSLLAFAEARRFNCADHTWIDLVVKRSSDNGQTWSALQIVYSNSSSTYGNTTIGNAAPGTMSINSLQLSSGRILMIFSRNNLQVLQTYSDDDGHTWSSPTNISGVVLSDWNWIGTGPPGSIQLPSGRVLVPCYHGPFAWDDGEWTHSHVMYSDDGGVTWTLGATLGSLHRSNECQVAMLADGSVFINARTLGQKRVGAVSSDGGQTFGNVFEIEGLMEPFEGCEGSTIRMPNSSALIYSGLHTDILFRYNLSIHLSYNNGVSFTPVKIIDNGPSGYSSLAVLPGAQTIGMLYERSNTTSIIFVPQHISYTIALDSEELALYQQRRAVISK